MECYLYIIRCKNQAFYTGISINFISRWQQHQKGTGAKYIRAFGFGQPVFLQRFNSKSEAMKYEIQMKQLSRKKKIELIESKDNILFNNPKYPLYEWCRHGYKPEKYPYDIKGRVMKNRLKTGLKQA